MIRILFYLVTALLPFFSFSQDSLVAYWSFDTIKGNTFYDLSGNGYHGTNYGAQQIQGVKSEALYFDGSGTYARIPGTGQPPPEVLQTLEYGSISLWFRVDHIPTDFGIAPIFYYGAEEMCSFFDAANQGLIIEVGHSPIHMGSKRLYFTIWKNGCTYPSFCYDSANPPIVEGKWYHLVVVVGEDYNTGYLDGAEMVDRHYNFGTPSYSQFFADAVVHEKLWLGKGYWDETVQHFEGAIDEIRIFNTDLNAAQVESLYVDTLLSDQPTGIPAKPSVKMFPNPASKFLNFQVSDNSSPIRRVKIVNTQGQTVLHKIIDARLYSLDVIALPSGLYTADITHDEGSVRKKVLITDQ